MRLKVLGLCAALLGSATMAQADSLIAEVAGWEIYRSPSMGNGCYMSAAYDDGTLVQLGFDLQEDAGFLTVFHDDWTEITDGETYPVEISMDSESYTADALGMDLGDAGGLLVMIHTEDFFVDMGERNTLSLVYDGDEVALVELGGTRAAIIAVADCLGGA